MKIAVVGSGYVGLVTGACLADVGNDVVCLDNSVEKIATLNAGGVPIFEPGLAELIKANVQAGRLTFTCDIRAAVSHGGVIFIAVGTPQGEDGSADLRHVLDAAQSIALHMTESKVIVNKSTVPVGTADRVRQSMQAQLDKAGNRAAFAVVSNPEFLKEGVAIADFMRPDRVVIGADSAEAIALMRQLYAPFERNRAKLIVMDLRSAELTKYAANAMLATRISFMNELSLIAERLGADIEQVRHGIGSDTRIGPSFLYAGCGYGGSCFPKDVRALSMTAREVGCELRILGAVEAANAHQKQVVYEKIASRLGPDLRGKRIAVWGLAFKPNTDDMREAPSLALIERLLANGASVATYDPVATPAAANALGHREGLQHCGRALDAAAGADALAIITEWKEFRSFDLHRLHTSMRQPLLFDGRNILDAFQVRSAGFEYWGIGRP